MVLCFGLLVVRSQIILEGNNESIRELCDHYQVKGGHIYKATLEKMLKVDDSGEGFQRTFILYILCTLFVPHAKQYVSEKYLHTLVDMKIVRKIAWGKFAYSTLVEAICRVKDGKVANVGGFVLFLQIPPCDVSTKLDERGNEDNEQPLLVLSKGLPNLASGVKDEHLHVTLIKALEQISDLQCIVGEHEAWRVEVEKELARRELHDTQMSCVIEDLHQKIATQDTIIETLREQLSKKETSTENEFNKRYVHESIYVSKSPVKQDEAFVHRAAFKTLELGGLLDDMVIDTYMRILDNQQRESGPPHQKRTYYGSSHLHQFMRKCVMEHKFSSGVPIRRNSADFDIKESDRVFIPVNRSGVHWFLVEVDLLCRKVTILDSMIPRRTEQIALEIHTLLAGLEYVFEGKQSEGSPAIGGPLLLVMFFPFIHLTSTSRKKKTRHPGVLVGMGVWEQRCNGGKHRQHGERRGIASNYDSGVVLLAMENRDELLDIFISGIIWKQHLFIIRGMQSTYENSRIHGLTVVASKAVDFIEEMQFMLHEITLGSAARRLMF
ncbi:hypothetical protein HHK36_021083 [Tetracentron sinense]|uniref:Ubiquitin-like protease family profile domain-containing protein n=1 Tax=Tetracentron sinense TaxID=13715 RepID=A0A834YP76_TETSI|nr:hypothetical protein HHK36_021083 [Tetracentron sinense]